MEDAGADAPPAARDVRPDARRHHRQRGLRPDVSVVRLLQSGFLSRMSRLERIRADRAPVPESRRAAGQRPYADRYGRQSASQRLYRFGDARREADRPELHHLRRTDAGRRAALCAPAAPRLRTRDGRCGRAPFADPRRGGFDSLYHAEREPVHRAARRRSGDDDLRSGNPLYARRLGTHRNVGALCRSGAGGPFADAQGQRIQTRRCA